MTEKSGKSYVLLEDRGLIGLAGGDGRTFLQGLICNDIDKVAADRAIHAAFLTPQGKYLHDFFITEDNGGLLVDCEGPRLDDLKKRLTMYKLRADVEITDRTPDFKVAALLGSGVAGLSDEAGSAAAFAGGVAYVDPRLAAMGVRIVVPGDAVQALEDAEFTQAPFADYDTLRINLGLADGSRDMTVDKAILLENGFDEMGSADWNKGCYLGQELTARTKHRGLIKKRLAPVEIDGPAPAPGTPVLLGADEAGEMRSSCGNVGLALLRIEHLEKTSGFVSGEAKLTARKPDWMKF